MLEVRDVAIALAATTVLDGVDLDVGPADVVALLGASGSGKSTLLRLIAGLAPPDHGTISWDGADLAGTPAHRRHFGMVFQDHVLFPHRDVGRNIELGLRFQQRPAPARRARVAEMLALVGLSGYERRRIATLSGGEQQRVALARALAPAPRLLLLDEPFGALDRPLRDRLVTDVGDIVRRTNVPAIVVTHDRDEAFAIADRVGVLAGGRIVQCAAPNELWRAPVDEQVAALIGLGPAVDVRLDSATVDTPWGRVPRPDAPASVSRVSAGLARMVLRPDALTIAPDGAIAATVRRVAPRGGRTMVEVRLADGALVWAAIPPGASPPAIDAETRVAVSPDAIVLFPVNSPATAAPPPGLDGRAIQDAGTSSPSAVWPAGVANDQ